MKLFCLDMVGVDIFPGPRLSLAFLQPWEGTTSNLVLVDSGPFFGLINQEYVITDSSTFGVTFGVPLRDCS